MREVWLFAGVFLLVGAVALLARLPPDDAPIYMQGGERVETGVSDDARLALDDKMGAISPPDRSYFVAQYNHPLSQADRDSLAGQLGIRFLDAIPTDSYVISLPTMLGNGILSELQARDPPASAIVSIRATDKLSFALYDPGLSPGTAAIKDYIRRPEGAVAKTHIEVFVQFFGDTPLDIQRESLKRATDADWDVIVDATTPPRTIWSVWIPDTGSPSFDDDLLELADENYVQSIEPASPPAVQDMDTARERVGVNASVSETGAGVVIAQWEICQPDNSHADLGDVWKTETDQTHCLSGNPDVNNTHATLVAGVMTSDANMLVEYRGVAPAARIVAFDTYGPDPMYEYPLAIGLGASISNNSWGFAYATDLYSNVATEPWYWYPKMAAHYDAVTSGRNEYGETIGAGKRILIVASSGNRGNLAPWSATRIANSAKNVISVGSIASGQDDATDMTSKSSGRGPTLDGRLSPLLTAPGIEAGGGAKGIRSTIPGGAYDEYSGTSFSTPIVSGVAALLTEKFRNVCSGQDPVPAELRGLLVHTARDLMSAEQEAKGYGALLPFLTTASPEHPNVLAGNSYVGPDYIFGFGLIQADKAIQAIDGSHFVTTDIEQGLIDFPVLLEPSMLEAGHLRVTLVWDDPPHFSNGSGLSPTTGYLQNDLDLVVIAPNGTRHYPWVLDPDNPQLPAKAASLSGGFFVPGEIRDHRNTVEQITVEVPASLLGQTWTLRVRGSKMLLGPQNFTLVSNAINPASACDEIPSIVNPYPPVPPDNPLDFFLLTIAIIILALLIFALLRRMYDYYVHKYDKRTAILQILLMLIFLLVIVYLLFRWEINALAIFLLVLAIYSYFNNQ